MIIAKTLDRSAGYPAYEATCAFWEQRGFVQVDTIDPLPGWKPGNPAAIYVAAPAGHPVTPAPINQSGAARADTPNASIAAPIGGSVLGRLPREP